MSVVYPFFIFLLCLSVDACNARSLGVNHVKAWISKIKTSHQVENGAKKLEVMKMGMQKVGRNEEKRGEDLIGEMSRILSTSSNLVSNKHFDSVSMAVPPKTHYFDHPIFHSDYDRPKPKPPCHN